MDFKLLSDILNETTDLITNLDIDSYEIFEGDKLSIKDFSNAARKAIKGNSESIRRLSMWFGPTGILQEFAMSCGCHDQYMTLASNFDKAIGEA